MRIDRRTVLKVAMSASALGVAGTAASVAGAGSRASGRILYDDRFAAARAFACSARREGLAVTGFSGDLTRLWRDRLRLDFDGAGSVIGVTTPRAMLCLQQLSADHGWRIGSVRQVASDEAALVRWVLAPRRGTEGRLA
jgi:hypothetical protein